MPPEQKIVVVRAVNREFQEAPPQFNVRNRSGFRNSVARAGMDHEQGEFAAAGIRLELLARVGYPIYFMVNTRKKSDPRSFLIHEAVSGEISEGAYEPAALRKTRRKMRCTAACSNMRMQAKVLST